MASALSSTVALALGLLVLTLVGECHGQSSDSDPFRVGYYNGKCNQVNVEGLVHYIVNQHFKKDKDTVADLVRLQFHDCFVRGCDASIMLEGENSELTAIPNTGIGGIDLIEEIKVALDRYCPGVVSCADIIVLGARSAAFMGGAYWYDVETGRKDGNVSLASEANQQLPGLSISIPDAVKMFGDFGLDTADLVYLLGCHTTGTAHCGTFQYRLYNFNGSGKPDPSMAPSLVSSLQKTCPRDFISNNEAFLDQTRGSEFVMDNSFFKRILENKGVLEVDQALANHYLTRDIVIAAANDPKIFLSRVGPAMRRMGYINILTQGVNRLATCKKVRH